MSKDEIITNANELIDNCNCYLEDDETDDETFKWFEMEKKTIQSLLDLYQKEKEKNKELDKKFKYAVPDEIVVENYIHKDKIREQLLEPIRKEADKINKKFFEKDKGFEVEGAVLQELGAIEGMILELLEDNNGK